PHRSGLLAGTASAAWRSVPTGRFMPPPPVITRLRLRITATEYRGRTWVGLSASPMLWPPMAPTSMWEEIHSCQTTLTTVSFNGTAATGNLLAIHCQAANRGVAPSEQLQPSARTSTWEAISFGEAATQMCSTSQSSIGATTRGYKLATV